MVVKSLFGLAGLLERAGIRAVRLNAAYPPLFIVGAPRSGTTAAYLHLLNRFKFSYFPNISKWYPSACITATLAGRRLYHWERTYENCYGVIEGRMAPSDGWDIFNRWFPRYGPSWTANDRRLHELRSIVRWFELIFGAPFANKNNANSTRIARLAAIFPEAIFVHIHRDRTDTALSLMEARREHGIQLGEWWSAAPPQFLDREFSNPLEQAVYQTWGVDRFIRGSLARIPSTHWRHFSYSSICARPHMLEQWVEERYARAGVQLRRWPREKPTRLRLRRRAGERPAEARRIRSLLENLDREWDEGVNGVSVMPPPQVHGVSAQGSGR